VDKLQIKPAIPLLTSIIINEASKYYSNKDFEYPLVGSKQLPDVVELHRISYQLIHAAENRPKSIKQIAKNLEDELKSENRIQGFKRSY
jgi:hypothetical protein